jgi:DNA polymerase-3 subunit gamma/tau
MRDALSLLDQALAHATGRLDATEVVSLLGGAPFELRAQILRAIADGDTATALVELGALLDSGHEPRRVAEDLLRSARDAFLLTAGAGRVSVDGTEEERATLAELGTALGTPTVVRVIETLGQAIVDMRGVDAADPRLVLEVALVRLSRREAGPPIVMLEERVARLENASAASPAPAPSAAPGAPSAPSAPSTPTPAKRALGAVRSERAARTTEPKPKPEPAAEPEPTAEPEPVPEAPPPAATGAIEFDLDDVVLAWATVLPDLPMATRSQVQHAQPIRIEGDVIVFGVAPQALAATKKRFQDAADTIRDPLIARLGHRPKFQLEPSDLVDLAGSGGRSVAVAKDDAPPPIDDEPPVEQPSAFDPGDFVDAEPAGPAVSSVGLLEAEFGATVIEERPRQ